ncbi:FtsX-like permease family protein [Embleya sp. NBC_00896]|uniref:ABC transporter permease n=1 Tax=Embleya sp. NBC_00896 TaxID=2975961 RepID=UPI002F916A9D|nr:ABC transporter permease [Embleya sp. NBC_00896]
MYRTALRNVLAHKGRLVLTALAVMLGTAFVAGTLVFSDTADRAMRNSNSENYTDVSVLVTDEAAGSSAMAARKDKKSFAQLTDATVARLAALPGVERARGLVTGFVGVADKSGDLIGPVWSDRGANFVPDAAGNDARYPMTAGRGPRTGTEIALDKETANRAGYSIGDTVRIAANGPAVQATLTGVFRTNDPMVAAGGTLTLMDTASAQRMLLTPGQYDSIAVTAEPGVSESALPAEITPVLPSDDRFTVETGRQLKDDQAERIAQRSKGMRTALLTFAGISLFVGMFIIANTFTMLIAQRTRELALLRALGAGRSQVTTSVLIEAHVIGVTAAAAGLLVGIGLGAGLNAGMKALNPTMPTGALVVTPTTVGVVLAVGTLITVLSAALPALRASRIPPLAAMRDGDGPAGPKALVGRTIVGTLLTAAGLGLIALGASIKGHRGSYPIEFGAVLALIGVFVLLPLLARAATAPVGPALARLFGTPGRLARLNAVRNPRRTAATAAALTIGLTLITALSVIGGSVTKARNTAVTNGWRADYIVVMGHNGLAPQLVSAIAAAPGVVAASPTARVYWELDGTTVPVEGRDADSFDRLVDVTMRGGSTEALKQGRALINAEVAASRRLSVGSTVRVRYPDASTGTITVGGVFEDNPMLASVLMSNAAIAERQPHAYISDMLVKGTDGATAALKQAIKDATGGNPMVDVSSKQDMREQSGRTVTLGLRIMYTLLAMSVLIAILGVINTLAMSVVERRHEIGMLRAIGLDRGGVRLMVRLESVVISVFGAVVGVALGTFLAWAAVSTLSTSIPGIRTVIPYGRVLLFVLLAGLVGMIAAWWPARRAAGLDILASIAPR